jgi:serine protease Do
MHDAVVEHSIVGDRSRDNADPAAILPGVSDDGKHDLLVARDTVDAHLHAMGCELRQDAENRVQIHHRTAQDLHVLRVCGHDRIESESGDAEVTNPVRGGDVNVARVAIENHIACCTNFARDTEDCREVVAGSEGEDSENPAPEVELSNGEVDGAIASADNDAIVSSDGTLGGDARQITWTRAGVDVDARSARDQILLDLACMPLRFSSAGRRVVQELQMHFHPYVARMRAMKSLRTLFIVIALTIACKPYAESRTAEADPAPAARPAEVPIPPTVNAVRRTPVVVVAHNVLPSVVNIQTEATIRQRAVDPSFDPFGFFAGRERSYTSQALGSGFIWSSDGIIVTNNHVVEGASRITVNFQDGSQVAAKLIGVDPDSDLAVLRVDSKNLIAAPIGTSSDLLIGESVVAVGNPFGLSGTVTTGVVSALGRSVTSKEAGRTFTDFIQTDASINPGNSGGPLLNIEGKVIGINTAIYAQAQGIGFAIPVDRAKKVIQDLLRYGQVHSAWIGAVTATLTPEEAKRLGIHTARGALVARVFSGSPAQTAGLKPGDIITSVDGRPVDSREAFSTLTATAAAGQPISLAINREGSPRTLQVQTGEPPAGLGLRILEEVAGLRVADQSGSVVIDAVVRGSRSQNIGLASGDVIVGANGVEVHSTRELNDELVKAAERSSIVLSVARDRYVYNLTFPMGT